MFTGNKMVGVLPLQISASIPLLKYLSFVQIQNCTFVALCQNDLEAEIEHLLFDCQMAYEHDTSIT